VTVTLGITGAYVIVQKRNLRAKRNYQETPLKSPPQSQSSENENIKFEEIDTNTIKKEIFKEDAENLSPSF
jgi:hypothetical protein